MRVAHYLNRNPAGLFYVRLRVPPDLWEALGGRVIKRAAGTRSSRSAQAIAVLLSARYAQIFATLRRGGAMAKPPSLEDILSGRSGEGGDIRTWNTDDMEGSTRGVRLKGMKISDDDDKTTFKHS